MIAKEAGVSNGSLFTYFETKSDLFNRLYIELKTEMASAALDELKVDSELREQLLSVWTHWLRWATASPEKRRTIAHLDVSAEITAASHQAARQTMMGIARLLEQCREHGPMKSEPLEFMVAMMSALADTTIDFMLHDSTNADHHCQTGFDALWRIIT